MKLCDIVMELDLLVHTGEAELDVDVAGGYCSDLMSDVIANAEQGELWMTLQVHQNIVAVAVLKSLCGIILVNDREPEKETIEKAETENLPLMTSPLSTFQLAGRLFELGLGRK